jgi:Ulp1 family protease
LPGNHDNTLFHVVEANYVHDVDALGVTQHAGKGIFANKRVMIPLNVNRNHWITAVINCFESPGIVRVAVFDSMGPKLYPMDRLLNFVKRVCEVDQNVESAQQLRLDVQNVPNLPRQIDNDCAIFAYLFASCICLQANLPYEQMQFPFRSESMVCYRMLLTDALLSRSRLLSVESIISVGEHATPLTAVENDDVLRVQREAEARDGPFLRIQAMGKFFPVSGSGILRVLNVAENGWLNDEGVNAAIALVCHINTRCICFDSLHFSSLQHQLATNAFRMTSIMNRLRRAFDATPFLLLPIHKSGNHWILATISRQQDNAQIRVYDSLDRDESQVVLQSRRNFEIETTLCFVAAFVTGMYTSPVTDYSDAFREAIQYSSCPKQGNNSDCGMHVVLSAMCLSESSARGERPSLHFQPVDIPVYRKKLALRLWHSRVT